MEGETFKVIDKSLGIYAEKEGVFLAGDVLLNGSLNAAMIAGERAAMGVLEAMGKRKLFG
jgi:hypothetical protein